MKWVLVLLPLCWQDMFVHSYRIRIGAFNIQHFGDSKMKNPLISERITKIVNRYDLILIQEIRDKDESSLIKLRDMLQRDMPDEQFQYVASQPLGRSSRYKEQYAYFYRNETVTVLDTYQFNDTNYWDAFEREPFSVLVRVTSENRSMEMALIGLHAKPTDVISEVKELDHVILGVLAEWQPKNLVVLGDLNADCRYAKAAELDAMAVFTDFKPLIGHDMDTTVKTTTTCAYDRINIHGNDLVEKIVEKGVDNFEVEMGLSNEEALKTSDHFPVYFSIEI